MATIKTKSTTSGSESVKSVIETRFNTLRNLTPDRLTNHIELFEAGDFYWLATVMRQMQNRDDIWKISAAKTRKAVSSRRWSVIALEGYEADPDADKQIKALTEFYTKLRLVDSRCKNIRHGMRSVIENIMRCYNDEWSILELVFSPTPNGSLSAEVTACPLELFRIKDGSMCLVKDGSYIPLERGGWMAVKGDGVGVACCVAKMFKTISLADWLVYSGRCGQPGLHGKTSAQKGTQQWTDFKTALGKFGKEWACVTGLNDVIEKIDLSVSGQLPFPGLVERMDRAIASLQRGADLSTMSAGQGQGDGASLQGSESDLILADNCAIITDAFRSQLDAVVLEYLYGEGVEIKAGFFLEPPQADTVDRDTKIDTFLRDSGVKLSKNDALKRYQRREADATDPEDGALTAPAAGVAPDPAVVPSASPAQPVVAAADAGASVADTALNGAQIASLVQLLSSAATKAIPMDSLLPILKASFPTIPDATLQSIVKPLFGFTPSILPNEAGDNADDPVAKRREALAKREEGDDGTKSAEKGTPPPEAILEAFSEKQQEAIYKALLDAAIEGSKKGEQKA